MIVLDLLRRSGHSALFEAQHITKQFPVTRGSPRDSFVVRNFFELSAMLTYSQAKDMRSRHHRSHKKGQGEPFSESPELRSPAIGLQFLPTCFSLLQSLNSSHQFLVDRSRGEVPEKEFI